MLSKLLLFASVSSLLWLEGVSAWPSWSARRGELKRRQVYISPEAYPTSVPGVNSSADDEFGSLSNSSVTPASSVSPTSTPFAEGNGTATSSSPTSSFPSLSFPSFLPNVTATAALSVNSTSDVAATVTTSASFSTGLSLDILTATFIAPLETPVVSDGVTIQSLTTFVGPFTSTVLADFGISTTTTTFLSTSPIATSTSVSTTVSSTSSSTTSLPTSLPAAANTACLSANSSIPLSCLSTLVTCLDNAGVNQANFGFQLDCAEAYSECVKIANGQ